jgi:hypothetical protein
MKIGRNEPCPCGSGRKVKRCCGVESAKRRVDAGGDLLVIPFHFPRYRPVTPSFEAWARVAPAELRRDVVAEGVSRLDMDERERIVDGFAGEYPEIWSAAVADLGNEGLAIDLVLGGAVVAGVKERRRLPRAEALDLLESEGAARADPVAALALTLDGTDLWSVIESEEAADALERGFGRSAITLRSEADRLATPWHRERLGMLVERLRASLPLEGYPLASAAIERACGQFEADEKLARRLLAELLLDSLPRLLAAAA